MRTEAKWYLETDDGRLLCQLCPRACRLKEGDRGFCFVRQNIGGKMDLDTYGKSTGFCIDPIEKKPLNHFLPGTPVLSFGTAGCNLGCKFCQNWDISKSREVSRLSDRAMPHEIAAAARRTGCRSVAYTYNDPVIWAEYAIDTAHACREAGIKSVAVTAGYITEQARGEFFGAMDAANIDLKSFNEDFYFKLTGSHLQPVLDTIEFVANETDCWVELTNLIIPGANDSADEIERMCEWIARSIGPDVPIHFTAFHPDFRMNDRGRTELQTLVMAYDIARRQGLNYVYVGNVHDVSRQSTYCHHCGKLLIERDWHRLGVYQLSGNRCAHCGEVIPGCFEDSPGDWGAKRQPVRIEPVDPPPVFPLSPAHAPSTTKTGTTVANETPLKAQPKESMSQAMTDLDAQQKAAVLTAASRFVQAAVTGASTAAATQALGELAGLAIEGVFVTVKRGETLRGCCGQQGASLRLESALAESAARTARDPRMPPLTPNELPYLDLSVSLLGPPTPIQATGAKRESVVQVGRHGLRIQLGNAGGLLLPQVAIEQGWSARQFLDAVCRKAGLPAGTWQRDDATLMLFDGVCFGGPFEIDPATTGDFRTLLPNEDLRRISEWVRSNLNALVSGATPMYYATGVSDGEALGLLLTVRHPAAGEQQWLQLSVRETRPMQSSLYQMTEQAARWLSEQSADHASIEIAVLDECVHHGNLKDADLRGVDASTHAIVVTDGRRWAVSAGSTPEASVQRAAAMETFRSPASVYSMRCARTAEQLKVSVGPRGEAGIRVRPPAVAGMFYPAEDSDRETMVDALLEGLEPVEKQNVFAAMVPHAGLRFSGVVAAEVWRRINVPTRVLIIGPKHTPDGVDWAVAPHDRWQMSDTASIVGDVQMSVELAGRIPGMQLDAAAHRREHGIEVQLPLMRRFCPGSKLAAIAMQGADVEELEAAADALAQWYREQEEPPLIVISSDMNHFAAEQENRRRDRLALDALATGDGAHLLSVCREENISMCGQVPAALVLMVLRQLGTTIKAREIAYATSGDSGGDRQRVVGYAGVLW